MVYRKWHISTPEPKKIKELSQKLGVSQLLCEVLLSRGYSTKQAVQSALERDAELSNPMLMKDMDKLAQRVRRAVDTGEKIVVYGDYDADGVTATALMLSYLESIGATVFYKLPNREDDGYGLSKAVIDLLVRKKVTLLFTVDNGVSALDEVAYANSLGLDVVITDHHLPPPQLPAALAVVDPLRMDDESPAKNLSGVGVAFKAICAIEGCQPEEILPFYGELVAIGTVADMMSLTGENRAIVSQGVECLQNTERCGLRELICACGLEGKQLTTENISFGLAPRMNAAGRMQDAAAALQLLITEDEEEACDLVAELNACNVQRQETEQHITEELVAKIDADPVVAHRPVLVVWGTGYHQGVIGIVASHLLERYGKPTIVCTVDAAGNARGSGRSFEGFSLYKAIASCADLLERFGGHDLAAGLSLPETNLEAFAQKINEYAADAVIEPPALRVDGVFNVQETSVEDVEQLSLMAPFGSGNPAPLFLLDTARIDGIYPVSEGKHVRLRFAGTQPFQAVLFGMSPSALPYRVGDWVDVVLSISVYQSSTQKSISGRIKALRPHGLKDDYFIPLQLYRRFLAAEPLTAEQKAQLRPSRADVIWLYKEITEQKVNMKDLRPQFARYGEQNAGKLMVALDVLYELGHIVQKDDETGVMTVTGGHKKALEDSKILRSLA